MKTYAYLLTAVLTTLLTLGLTGCNSSSSSGGSCPEPTLDIAVCDPSTADFSSSTTIDNPYFPLTVGMELVLEGEEDGETIKLVITVPGDTKTVAGVETLVMVETEYEDGELIEISKNYMAQTADGTVCYFGEDVDDYEGGVIVSHGGAWLAGVDGALPGIMMPANPQVGDAFYQEYAEGVAEDMGSIVALGETLTVSAGTFDDTVTAEDCNPLEDAETDEKVYASGIGIALDANVELISY